MKRLILLLTLAIATAPSPAQRRLQGPPPELEKKVLLERLSRSSEKPWQMEWDETTQRVRQLRSGLYRAGRGLAREAARRFVQEQSGLLDLPASTQLMAIDEKGSRLGTHVWFEQQLQGIPIYGSHVSVHLDPQGRVFWVNSQVASTDRISNRLQVTEDLARLLAIEDVKPDLSTLRGPVQSRLYLASRPQDLRYVWNVLIPANEPLGDWSYLVDGESGEVLEKSNLLQFARGRVFYPNPVVTLKDPTLRDPDAQDTGDKPTTAEANCDATAVPGGAYRDVELTGLAPSGLLDGEFVTTGGKNVPLSTRAKGDPNFVYSRCDSRFDEVNVYYAIDSIQRYIQQLGFRSVNNRSIPVNANGVINFGRSQDQSFYSPETGELVFGLGGIHDAEDSEIVVHEYGHSIQDNQVAGFARSNESRSIGEGFADILAALFFVPYSGGFHDELVGEWDATFYDRVNAIPRLRTVASARTFADYDPSGDVHRNGTIWAACIWDFFQRLGATLQARDLVLRTLLESQFLYRTDESFAEAAQALITADEKLSGGANRDLLTRIFIERGIFRDNSRLPAAQLREAEPNNTLAAAQALTESLHVISGEISSASDIDYYRFPVRSNQLYVIEVYARRLSPPSPLDSMMAVLDISGNPVPNSGGGFLENDDIADGVLQDSRILFAGSTDGNLLLRVSSFRSETRGSYVLLVYPTQNALRIPRVSSSPGGAFTGMAFANAGSAEAIVGLILLDDNGQIVNAENPRLISLGAGKQIALLDSELFGYRAPASGWLEVHSNSANVRGYFLYGSGNTLLGADAIASTSTESLFLLAGAGATATSFPSSTLETEINLVNPNAAPASVQVTVYNSLGQVVLSQPATIRPFGRLQKLLSDWVKTPLSTGYVRIRSDRPLTGFEVHGDQRKTGLRLRAISEVAEVLYVPHFAEAPAGGDVRLFTVLNLVNPTAQRIQATLTALTDSGSPVEDLRARQVALEPGQSLEGSLRDLFGIGDPSRSYVGSLEIRSSPAGVLGAVRFAQSDNQYLTAMPIEPEARGRIVFSQVAHGTIGGASYLSGVVLQNPGTQTTRYTLKVFGGDATLLAQTAAQNPLTLLQPRQRVAKLLSELIPDMKAVLGGYMVVESPAPLLGFGLILQPGNLVAVPPQ
ncbi:MAG: M36 family metallopeptidase [Acidobacteria bacterium]|nr:M36 family metallopeptidase [Acidobacteriota bacterium]